MEKSQESKQTTTSKTMMEQNLNQLSRILSAKRKAKMKLNSMKQSTKPTNLSEKPLEQPKARQNQLTRELAKVK